MSVWGSLAQQALRDHPPSPLFMMTRPTSPGQAGILEVAHRLVELLRGAPLLPRWHLTRAEAEHVYYWLKGRFGYVPDPPDREVVKHAAVSLAEIRAQGRFTGDCDDAVVLLGTLYRGMGYPVRLVLYSTRPDGEYEHVSLDVEVAGEWLGADLTVPGAPLGWEIPAREWTTDPLRLPV